MTAPRTPLTALVAVAALLTLLVPTSAHAGRKPTVEGYRQVLRTWEGSRADDLIRSWGVPQSTFDTPGGARILIYQSSSSYTTPTYSVSSYNDFTGTVTTNRYGGHTYRFSCTTEVEVRGGLIVHWRFEGNACTADERGHLDLTGYADPHQEGVVVMEVERRGTAHRARIRPGDVVTAVAGEPVTTPEELDAAVFRHFVGKTIKLEVMRDGDSRTVRVRLRHKRE